MKYALIIGNNKYDDAKLAQLKTPAADSQALAKILGDETIGSFDEVTPLINQTESIARRAISAFLGKKKPDDLVLLYFSGHGILDDRGRLYLALKDTQVDLLKATSIPSSFVADEMDSCRSKRQLLILDCCHSGAFARGTKGEQKAITETTFEGSGFGRVVLTASDSTQYALEGDQIIKQTELSLFTHFLLEGLKTGEADTNHDGHISLDEWYDYTYAKVISETPRQVPHKWSYNQRGDLILARNPYLKKKVAELPPELIHALESSFVGIRESAVNELGNYLRSSDPEMVALAVASFQKMKEDDSRRISSLAERLLSEFEQARTSGIGVTKLEPAAANAIKDSSPLVPSSHLPVESPAGTLQPKVEKTNIPADRPSASQKFGFIPSFWLRWAGTSFVGLVLSIILYNYAQNNLDYYFALPFGIVAALTGIAQWWWFRHRLEQWWMVANAAAGAVLGAIHYHRYSNTDWGHDDLTKFLAIWLLGNLVLGLILIRQMPERSKDTPAMVLTEPGAEIAEKESNQGIFLRLLLVFLLLYAVLALIDAASSSGLSYIFDSLIYPIAILTAIISILAGTSLPLSQDIPRNFGFIALAVFAVFNGIMVGAITINGDFPIYFFSIPGTMSLLASLFFVSRGTTWKHLRYIALSFYLIFVSLVYFGIDDINGTYIFSIITAIFALLAAIFFFFRK